MYINSITPRSDQEETFHYDNNIFSTEQETRRKKKYIKWGVFFDLQLNYYLKHKIKKENNNL